MPVKKFLIIFTLVFLDSFVINGFLILGYYIAVSEYGTSTFLWFTIIIILLLVFLAFVLGLFSIIGTFIKKTRNISFIVLFSSFIFILASYSCLYIGGKVYMNRFKTIAIQSRPLITAINNYDDKYGHPPDKLQDLVPEFLPKIPRTGIKENPEYVYKVYYPGNGGGNRWTLTIHPPFMGIGWDEFIYWPDQHYPDKDSSGWYEKVEDWAYYHE